MNSCGFSLLGLLGFLRFGCGFCGSVSSRCQLIKAERFYRLQICEKWRKKVAIQLVHWAKCCFSIDGYCQCQLWWMVGGRGLVGVGGDARNKRQSSSDLPFKWEWLSVCSLVDDLLLIKWRNRIKVDGGWMLLNGLLEPNNGILMRRRDAVISSGPSLSIIDRTLLRLQLLGYFFLFYCC